MGNFDPNLTSATLEFVDGQTSVDQNFLNSVVVRFGSIGDAHRGLVEDGDVGLVVLPPPMSLPGSILQEVELGVDAYIVESDGEFIYVAPENGDTVTILTEAGVATGRVVNCGAGPIVQILTDGRHLVVIGTSLEIWDLADDSLVGSASPSLPAGAAVHGGNLYLAKDTSVSRYNLTTGSLDAGFGVAGVATVSFATRITVDDFAIYLSNAADNFEAIDHSGDLLWTELAVTGQTQTNYLMAVNDVEFYAVGDTHVSRITNQGALSDQVAHNSVLAVGGRAALIRGWLTFTTSGGWLTMVDTRSFRKTLKVEAGDLHDKHVCTDGIDLITSASTLVVPPGGSSINGYRRFSVPGERYQLVQKIEAESFGRPPNNNLKVRPL